MRESLTMIIEGMHCQRCVQSVCAVLQPIPGVISVEVTLEPGQATIAYESEECTASQFRTAIENAGFDVR